MSDIIDYLIKLYKVWCIEQGLPYVSAGDQVNVTEEQETWLEAFIELWELSQ